MTVPRQPAAPICVFTELMNSFLSSVWLIFRLSSMDAVAVLNSLHDAKVDTMK
jgi:hypothetical protein